jgi:bifunctional DNA-binding transcriptional regulator/antitoxin component of YhaV-PrlF toxin-antitoxin module
MEETTLSVDEQGNLVLPERLREKYGLQAGDVLALFDLDGMLVLLPRTSRVPGLARESLLVGLYDLGKLSSGKAAELAGLSRGEFLGSPAYGSDAHSSIKDSEPAQGRLYHSWVQDYPIVPGENEGRL